MEGHNDLPAGNGGRTTTKFSYTDRRKVRKSQIFSVIERFLVKYPINQMCDFYNVSRQGYYDYQKRRQEGNTDQELIDRLPNVKTRIKTALAIGGYKNGWNVKKALRLMTKKFIGLPAATIFSITRGLPPPPRVYPLLALSVNVKTASNICLPPFTA